MIVLAVDYKVIGTRIKEKRKAAGKTQEQLAEILSVTVGYVSQMERGVTKINLDMLSDICAALETDMSFFVSGTATEKGDYLEGEIGSRFSKMNEKQKKLAIEIIDSIINNT